MSDVILERTFETPLTKEEVRSMAMDLFGCMDIYGVTWHESLLSSNGRKMFCHFQAPDAEALRNTFQHNNTPVKIAYPVTIHETEDPGPVNVVVERSFSGSVELADIAAIEEEGAWCLETYDVTFVKTYFSRDRRRMVCLYRAPDAESVRMAQTEARMPFDGVWSFQHLTQDNLFS